MTGTPSLSVRIDKWLWAARLYKTRALASEEVGLGRVQLNGSDVKPARELKIGDRLRLRQGRFERELIVRGLSHQRGPAPVAQQLYEETATSIQTRAELAERMRLAPEPAAAMEHGRPTKRERRDLQKGWDKRWSASVDD
jgi:ribosome-associated heat shock protein Hsp15